MKKLRYVIYDVMLLFNLTLIMSSASYPKLTQKMKKKIQTTQNKCIWYSLQPYKMTHILKIEFETPDWLPVKDRFNQFVNLIVFKYLIINVPIV